MQNMQFGENAGEFFYVLKLKASQTRKRTLVSRKYFQSQFPTAEPPPAKWRDTLRKRVAHMTGTRQRPSGKIQRVPTDVCTLANPRDRGTPTTKASRRHGQAVHSGSSREKALNSRISQETQTQQPRRRPRGQTGKDMTTVVGMVGEGALGVKHGSLLEVLVADSQKCKRKYPDLNHHHPHPPPPPPQTYL